MNLKPCPFCGDEPMLDNCASDGKGEHAPGPDDWLVGCTNQRCQMNAFSYTQESKDDAVSLWNTRVSPEISTDPCGSPWIPVSERLPDDDNSGGYWVRGEYNDLPDPRDNHIWYDVDHYDGEMWGGVCSDNYTHWQPIEAPE